MRTKNKPLYTFYMVGFPEPQVSFYKESGMILGINVEVKYHGCIVKSYEVIKDVWMTAPIPEKIKIDEENKIAEAYYYSEIGYNWKKQLKKLALELLNNTPQEDLPF